MQLFSRIGAAVCGLFGVAFLVGGAVVLVAPDAAGVDGVAPLGAAVFCGVMALTMLGVAAAIWWASDLTSGLPRTSLRNSLTQADQAMARGSRLMAAMTDQAALTSRLATTGEPATAWVVAAVATGAYVNLQPVVQVDLLVEVPGRPRFPVATQVVLSPVEVARVQPGAVLGVLVDPATPVDLVIDWSRNPAAA